MMLLGLVNAYEIFRTYVINPSDMQIICFCIHQCQSGLSEARRPFDAYSGCKIDKTRQHKHKPKLKML